MYYGGRLLDGCCEQERQPLHPGLPTLCFLDVRGQQQYEAGSRSPVNRAEAAAVCCLVARLQDWGVHPGSIGVICFFRAQVTCGHSS